ncbi:glycosyltransferase [Kineosporia sp. J2-2]|uniref:Glycosyltransferase n=1 Tax=Kineosporia corallincola TaxID=2835133 RepID=A0ABS5TEK6_9ACTN|nr:glycosyltransferase [Kineosporia corallincola]MBT0769515.1 glycosyltransferase [Kineosporia corallincola]
MTSPSGTLTFPDGQYLSVTSRLSLGAGGQTGMFLLRNRLFAEHAGITPTLVSFDDQADHPHIRAELLAAGRIHPSTVVLNLFEWLRTQPLEAQDDEILATPPDLAATVDPRPDGTKHRTRYLDEAGRCVVRDYHRPDGSVYLRRTPEGVLLAGPDGRIVRRFAHLGALRRWWLTRLFDPDPLRPVFLISDSRFALRHLVPLADRSRVRLIHVVHNIHVREPYRWDSPAHPTHAPVLDAIPRLDALVTLTHRQRDDISARFATANNLHVVPNPVDPQPVDDETPRQPASFVMLGRLMPQKRIDHAVRAFARMARQEPGATLDIHGDGEEREALAALIAELGLEKSVRLRGYDPLARESLRTATALLLTSRFEGYPLVVLEALEHGCPVIAYDIAYGPREQITHGTTGFLVPPGDLDALAGHMVTLARDPLLARRLGQAARASAADHSVDGYLRDWKAVLDAVELRRSGPAGRSGSGSRPD